MDVVSLFSFHRAAHIFCTMNHLALPESSTLIRLGLSAGEFWICAFIHGRVASSRCFTSPVGGSECSQVGQAGCMWGACVPLAQALLCFWKPDVESRWSLADRVAAGQIKKCLWPRPPSSPLSVRFSPDRQSRTRLATRSDAGRLAAGHPRIPLWRAVSGSADRKGGTKTTVTDLRAMHWQHGQVVQGAPRIQNYQSTPSGASEAGLQTLSHQCARYARLPANKLRGHVPEPRSTGHSRCLQTPEGAGLRGPVHSRWKYLIRVQLEHCGVAGY